MREYASVPNIPWEFTKDPHGFLKRYVRVLSIVPVGDGSWTPMLGVAGLEAGTESGTWDIKREVEMEICEDCDNGICDAC